MPRTNTGKLSIVPVYWIYRSFGIFLHDWSEKLYI